MLALACGAALPLAAHAQTASADQAPTASGWASGVDWTLDYGSGNRADVKKLSVIAGYTRPEPLWQGQSWRLRLRHELELGFWRVPKAKNIVEFGYSPVLRIERPLGSAESASTLFAEASIGVRLLSHTRLSDDHPMSTAFQFSDMLGLGWQFGRGGNHTLGLRYTHLSNAGIKKPNPGINFAQIYYTHRF